MRRFILSLFCALAPLPALAQGVFADNRLIVVPLGPTDFEVIEDHGEGPRGIWCAAASFALRQGVPGAARLYVKRPRGASVSGAGRIGVVFTTQAGEIAGDPVRSYSISVRQAGLSLPVAHANQFCIDYLIDENDRL